MGGPESSKSAFLDGSVCVYSISCLRGRESRKSAILNGKQLFLLYEGFRSIELKIDSFRLKTAVYMKSGVFRNFPVVWAKSWFVPFAKNPEWRLFEKDIFIARKGLFWYQEYNQTSFQSIFWGKMKRGIFQFWDQNHGLTPLQETQNGDFFKSISL